MKNSRLTCGLFVATLFLVSSNHALVQAGQKKFKDSRDRVRVQAKAIKPDASGKQVVTISLDVDKGWYIYANPVGNELLAPTATKVTVKSGSQKIPIRVQFPKPMVKKDDVVGDYKIYKGKVQIPVVIQRPQTLQGAMTVSVSINACDSVKGVCLPTGTFSFSLK